MQGTSRASCAVVLVLVLLMGGLAACESQEQRQKLEALTKQLAELQQENSRLKQEVTSLTRQADDLKVQLEVATKRPSASKK